MPFRKSYAEILEMIGKALLDTSMARAIVRRAGVWPAGALGGIPDIFGTFSEITDTSGYVGEYTSAEFYFPDGSQSMARYADTAGISEARILVTTTGVGATGSILLVEVDGGEGVRGFVDEPPSAPLDSIGLHVSEWRRFSWEPATLGRAALIRWVVSNPADAGGEFAVGLCQLQVR